VELLINTCKHIRQAQIPSMAQTMVSIQELKKLTQALS